MAETYITGAVIEIACAFTSSGVPIDPDTVQVLVKLPGGTTSTYNYPADDELVRDDVGVYHLDVAIASDGTHRVRFVATGAGAAAAETSFFAKSSFV